jgi:hypothetical protein
MAAQLAEVEFDFELVRQGIGEVTEEASRKLDNVLSLFGTPRGRPSYGMTIHWARGFDFFKLGASYRPPAVQTSQSGNVVRTHQARGRRFKPTLEPPSAPADLDRAAEPEEVEFSRGHEGWRELMVKAGYSREILRDARYDEFLDTHHMLAAEVPTGSTLIFNVTLDTDDRCLFEHVDQALKTAQSLRQGPIIISGGEGGSIEMVLWAELRIYEFAAGPGQQPRDYRGPLVFRFPQFDWMDWYDGYSAIDFGNTATTFACMLGVQREPGSIEITSVDPEGEGEAPSAVYLDEYEPPEDDLQVAEAVWEIGSRALNLDIDILLAASDDEQGGLAPEVAVGPREIAAGTGREKSPERLIVAPKRLVAVSGTYTIREPGVRQEIPKALPTELMISAVLKQVYKEHRTCPPRLAITYPSTYSSTEIRRLRDAVARGINRSLCETWHDFEPQWVDDTIPCMLDEATAAAFFFLYRDFFFFRPTGQLAGFSYLQRHGVNVLVFDCGGATTDVALVHAWAERSPSYAERRAADQQPSEADDSAGAGKRPWFVGLNVLGRTGLRRFGGDDITMAVFRVLKAELASKLSGGRLKVPQDPHEFADWYTAKESEIDKTVPTRFRHINPNMDSDGYELARRATKDFWEWAEKVKWWLGRLSETQKTEERVELLKKFPEIEEKQKQEQKKKGLRVLLQQRGAGSGFFSQFMAGRDAGPSQESLPQIMAKRSDHVDLQVRDSIEHCLDNTNRMIRERLTEYTRRRGRTARESTFLPELPPDSEVHRVYVVGKASRYPLVRRLIAERLNVRIINHDEKKNRKQEKIVEPDWLDPDPHLKRIVFDTANLKTAVAKGAVLALRVAKAFPPAEFGWDWKLPRRLAYTIFFEGAKGFEAVFLEHELYDDLCNKPRRLPDPAGRARQAQVIYLYRKWPGDEEQKDPAPFLKFEFTVPLRGPLYLTYVEDEEFTGFVIEDKGTGEKVRGVDLPDPGDLPPMQRGDL